MRGRGAFELASPRGTALAIGLCLMLGCESASDERAAKPEAERPTVATSSRFEADVPLEARLRLRPTALPMNGGSAGPAAGSERASLLGAFLSQHWRLPLPGQGAAPAGFSEVERSLDPAVCGSCHPAQLAQWQTSFHAGAFSAGFGGQLVEGELAAGEEVRSCQGCHAPLAEQMPPHASADPSARFDAALRAQGLVCAGCHVRGHRVYGPPRREGALVAPEPRPHGGFEVRPEYLESRFCAACHQFFDDEGPNGKPIENTFVEWQKSPQAAAGRSCQSCHMPDRAHLWRGIHDREMVRSGLELALVDIASEVAAERETPGGAGAHAPARADEQNGAEPDASEIALALVLASREVGHAFPTYVTPRVLLAIWQQDAAGEEIGGSRVQAVIGRQIDFASSPWTEVFDTRVAPGESVRLDYVQARRPGAAAVMARVTVDPDFHYRGVYETILPDLHTPEARARVERARLRAQQAVYVLWEARRVLAPPIGEESEPAS